MGPIPYRAGSAGRTDTPDTGTPFRCPSCRGELGLTNGSWTCRECGHVPSHGAD